MAVVRTKDSSCSWVEGHTHKLVIVTYAVFQLLSSCRPVYTTENNILLQFLVPNQSQKKKKKKSDGTVVQHFRSKSLSRSVSSWFVEQVICLFICLLLLSFLLGLLPGWLFFLLDFGVGWGFFFYGGFGGLGDPNDHQLLSIWIRWDWFFF